MRTALLAALKRTDTGDLRALMPLAGRSILGWQVDLAREIGCERIICLCEAPGSEIFSLQQESEALGNEFHAIRGIPQLVALLRTDDELLVMLDGLVVDRDWALGALGASERLPKQVLTLNPDHQLATDDPEDFERIDADRSWAGILTIRAEIVQKLAELPPDSDCMSLLLRLAVQSGTPSSEVPDAAIEEGLIALASSPAVLARKERKLIESASSPMVWTGPARALATLTGRQLELSGLRHSTAGSAVFSVLLLVAGAILAWTGFGAGGLAIAALGTFASVCATSLFSLRNRLFARGSSTFLATILSRLVEFAPPIVAVGALVPALDQVELIALPIFAFGCVAITSREGSAKARAFWSDRAMQLAFLSVSAISGFLAEGLAAIGLSALAVILLRLRGN